MIKNLDNKTLPEVLDYTENLSTQLGQQESKIHNLSSEIQHLGVRVSDYEFQIQEKDSEIQDLDTQISNYETELKQKNTQIEDLASEVNRYKLLAEKYKLLYFGQKRERFISKNSGQQELPFEVETLEDVPQTKEQETVSYTREKRKKKHPGRIDLPDDLPVEEIILKPKEDTTGMKCVGEEVTKKLAIVPAKLYIKKYIRPKYIKTTEDENCKGVIAELPSFAIDKGIADESLLAQVIVDKYVDHLPIYRQVERFKRAGINIPYATISGWQSKLAGLLSPLYEVFKHRILSQGYIQADETPIAVLDKNKSGKTHQGYHWVYHSPLEKSVLFDYRPSRSREGPNELLANFKGYLQTDGYAVYENIVKKEGITHLGCMAHARREFKKALDNDHKRASYAMGLFQKLYAVEQEAREEKLKPQEIHELRLDKALPITNELFKWMAQEYKNITDKKSQIAKAMQYTMNRQQTLTNYLYDGSLEIDNNLVENSIRPVALGRKNYLFAGSHQAAQNAAVFYSLLATCKKHNINPQNYFTHLLTVINDTKTSQLHQLLPQNIQLE